MASSSSSHNQNEEYRAFSGIEPAGMRRKVDETSRLYDVFINHRGPDVKQTLATQLYNSLRELGILVFLDSEEMELGDSFPSTIETAISSAAVHIAIFSKNYAQSPWCLEELVLMLQSRAKIIPVFYDVQPGVLRHIETGVYAEAFSVYENKGRYLEKLKGWKEALRTVSFITGEEFNRCDFCGFRAFDKSSDCENIVKAVQKEVERLNSKLHVAKYPVGLHKLVQDFERQCLDDLVDDFESQSGLNKEGKEKAQIVGIFGMGGIGKTTLSKELFNRKLSQYSRSCFLFDMREASTKRELPSLQLKLLRDLFAEDGPSFRNVEEGKMYIGNCIRKSRNLSLLIVLDDIDHVEQLDALMVMDMLNKDKNSLIIVTTRDVGVLISAGILIGYNLKGMDRDVARELFCWHAFRKPYPVSGYDNLVEAFLDGCGGLPLSLQILGTHVHGRGQNYWRLELNKVSKMLPRDIQQRLKISVDALDSEEKQIFMDIACFFIEKEKSTALRIWEGSGWNAQHALQTLKDKCLVEEISDWTNIIELRMHDHLKDLGREMANELNRPHRVWHPQVIESLGLEGFQAILAQSNWRSFGSIIDRSMDAEITYFIDNSDENHASTLLLWLELSFYNDTHMTSIPSWIPLQNLQYLSIWHGHLNRLWSDVQEPSSLKELEIYETKLEEFPDFSGMSNHLERVLLSDTLIDAVEFKGEEMPIEWLSFLDTITVNPWGLGCRDSYHEPSFCFESSSSSLRLSECKLRGTVALNNRGQSPTVKSPMNSLQKVELIGQELVTKVFISGYHYPNLEYLHLCFLQNLNRVDLNMVTTLKSLELRDCKSLKYVSGICDLMNLVELKISGCSKLEELPNISLLSCLKSVSIGYRRKQKLIYREIGKPLSYPSFSFGEDFGPSENISGGGICGALKQSIEQSVRFVRLETRRTRVDKSICTCLDRTYHKTYRQVTVNHEVVVLNNRGQSPTVNSPISSLQKVELGHQEFVTKVLISGYHYPNLESLHLCSLQNLTQVDLNTVTTLMRLTLECCNNLNIVSGISNLMNLVDLKIRGCSELLEELQDISHLSCLESVSIGDCEKLKLKELSVARLSFLKTISIQRCPKLEVLSGLAGLSFLETITIVGCEKLQNIAGIEELPALKGMQILLCSNTAIRNSIDRLQRVPSEQMIVIGSAAKGAEFILVPRLFSKWIAAEEVIQLEVHEDNLVDTMADGDSLGAIIYCAVVLVTADIFPSERTKAVVVGSRSLSSSGGEIDIKEWMFTTDRGKRKLPEFLMSRLESSLWSGSTTIQPGSTIIEKALMVMVKNGEEWKTLNLMKIISYQLLKK